MATTSGDGSVSLLAHALACASAGYPVIPCVPLEKARRTRKGTKPTTDPTRIREWWSLWPDANVGVVVSDLAVVDIDVDGPVGKRSLARVLEEVGLDSLPQTYSFKTGRADGGYHLLFRLPAGAVKLVTQYGKNYPLTPNLDIIFQGLFVAPGSIHQTGAVYKANADEMPPVNGLAELPSVFYEYLLRRGRVKEPKDAKKSKTTSRKATRRVSTGQTESHQGSGKVRDLDIPTGLRDMLSNTADGRDGRTLSAVTAMVQLGWDDDQIIETVLAFPLGKKALGQYDPDAYLHHKIETARQWSPRPFDKVEYWRSVHTSGMATGKVRILDVLLDRSSGGGVVTVSLVQIALDSALATAQKPVRELTQAGWLGVLVPGDRIKPTTYQLRLQDPGLEGSEVDHQVPHQGVEGEVGKEGKPKDVEQPKPPQGQGQVSNPLSSPYLIGLYGTFSVTLAGHDAFRPKQGSLSNAYPLLTLLTDEAQPVEVLARALRVSPRAMDPRVEALVNAGLATESDRGLTLTDEPLLPLLDLAARKAGTTGKREAARQARRESAEAWRRERQETSVPGSDKWVEMTRRDIWDQLERGMFHTALAAGRDPETIVDEAVQFALDALGCDALDRSAVRIRDAHHKRQFQIHQARTRRIALTGPLSPREVAG